jgi:uncharacterized membrane protein YozB (DUF420 family)
MIGNSISDRRLSIFCRSVGASAVVHVRAVVAVRRNSNDAKISAVIMLALWLAALLVGLVFYGILVTKGLEARKTKAVLIATFLFIAVCVYFYRSYAIRRRPTGR